MLLAATLDLEATAPATLPDAMGERVRGALFDALKAQDAALAADTHADRPVQPYTVAWFGPRGDVGAGARATVRWTAVEAGVARTLSTCVLPAVGATFDLSGQAWRVVGGGDWDHRRPAGQGGVGTGTTGVPPTGPWAGAATFEELARTYLIGGRRPPSRVELAFATPTTFHSAGRSLPLPLPRLVFGSLIERWNAFAPLRIDPEVLAVVDQAVTIGRYELRTEAVALSGGLQVGFVGRCGYILTPGRGLRPADEYAWRVLHLMGAYAFFAGVGAKTTMGMGTVRPVTGR